MKISKGAPIPRRKKEDMGITAERAQALALRALVFFTLEPERIERFFSLTGIDPADVRRLAGDPGFLLAILDHLAADEHMLLEFAQAEQERPEAVGLARRALGGGEEG